MQAPSYDDDYVAALFDRMGPTYDIVNRVSSFGFCEWWRRECARLAQIRAGDVVCDFMAGSGECWPYLKRYKPGMVIAIDFSRIMVERQARRRRRCGFPIQIRRENALKTAIPDKSVDCVVGAFGLKTLSPESIVLFANELRRILKPGGRMALLEISRGDGWLLGALYRWYLSRAIPMIGRLMLGDMDCYRMLGVYTEAFGSCRTVENTFRSAGFDIAIKQHFFGCASSISGTLSDV